MYATYQRKRIGNDATHYVFEEQTPLFGYKNGFIPYLLKPKIPAGQKEPFPWHVDVIADINGTEWKDYALVIDLKPKQKKTNLSLYELMDVWGYSNHGWSPILLKLNGLFVDEDPSAVDRNDFKINDNEVDGPIYEFLYLDGSVKDGNLIGRWNPPPASPTNAALLWPDSLRYFFECIHESTPEILKNS